MVYGIYSKLLASYYNNQTRLLKLIKVVNERHKSRGSNNHYNSLSLPYENYRNKKLATYANYPSVSHPVAAFVYLRGK